MNPPFKYSYIDFARAIGTKQYIVSEGQEIDLVKSLENNPLINGILNVGPYFWLLGNVHTWETL